MRVRDEHLERATAIAAEAMQRAVGAGVDRGALAIGFLGVALDAMRALDGDDALASGLREFARRYDERRAFN